MSDHRIGRRHFLKGAGLAALAATEMVHAREASAQIQVPNSSGTESPKLKAPANATDCHMHIYDPARFPMPPSQRVAPTQAAVPEYRLLQRRIGTTRVVIVQPRNYATDNRVTVDAIARLGPNARGVAVLHPTVSDAELKRLQDAGIRGIRFSLGDPATAVVTPDMIEPLAKRIADLGWHVQFNVEGEQIVALANVLRRLPTPMVFDHLAHPTLPAGIEHASHAIVRGLIAAAAPGSNSPAPIPTARSGHPIPRPPRLRKRLSGWRRSAWCGAAIGRTRACSPISRMMRSCSTCSWNGRPMW